MTLLATSLGALALSLLVNRGMEALTTPVRIIGSYVRLRLTHNPYIAFSIALPVAVQTILIAAALIAVFLVALRAKDTTSRIAFGLILGGALANIVDRLGDGFVTDYVSVGTFPVFNAADICITLGAGLLIFDGWVLRRRN